MNQEIFAKPEFVEDISECLFYQSIDLPEYGFCSGDWDLRENIDDYLGNSDFANKRVLDIGAANGYLSFHAELMGAEVISFDCSPNYRWDLIPFHNIDLEKDTEIYKKVIQSINNAYWLTHRLFSSEAKMVYGDIYHIPEAIGEVDVSILGAILEHTRDPFLGLQNALQLTREKVIIADIFWPDVPNIEASFFLPYMLGNSRGPASWWYLPPKLLQEFLKILGFEKSEVIIHKQFSVKNNRFVDFYTVIGERTRSMKYSNRIY
jgi:hypothetical protein